MRIRFDLHQLNIFCTIVELESFSKASKKLHLSQPTLSSHIKLLEENLGTELLDRSGRKIIPTRAGEILYDYAQRILALSREAEGSLNEFQKEFRGEIRVGAPPHLGEFLLPETIARFQSANPKVNISLEIAKAREIIHRVESRRIDLGIVGMKMSHRSLVFKPGFEDRIVLVAPAQHPLAEKERVTFDSLSRERIILREEDSRTRRAVEKLLSAKNKKMKEVFPNSIELGSCSAAREGVKKGLGLAFLPELSIKEDIQKKRVRVLKFPGTPIQRTFYLVYPPSWGESLLGKAFLAILKKMT